MKSVFITGANRGLGYGFVESYLKEGFRVFGGVRKITDELPQHENVVWVECDVVDDVSIGNAFNFVSEKTNVLDVFINNVGVNKDTVENKGAVSKLAFLQRENLLHMFNINTVSPLILIQTFLPLLKGDCFIINISSARASFQNETRGSTANYGYNASKVALNMMTLCSVVDLPENIKTFAVHPGSIRTEMNADGKNEPIEQAQKIIEITKNWKTEFNGKFLNYDGTYGLL